MIASDCDCSSLKFDFSNATSINFILFLLARPTIFFSLKFFLLRIVLEIKTKVLKLTSLEEIFFSKSKITDPA